MHMKIKYTKWCMAVGVLLVSQVHIFPAHASTFTDATLYVDPDSNAKQQIRDWQSTRPHNAVALQRIAKQPTAKWFGDWNSAIRSDIDAYITTVHTANALPVIVLYNIPGRDCGNYSSGGSDDAAAYVDWIRRVANGIGKREAVVILEPDTLSLDCLYETSAEVIAEAVTILKSKPHIAVYLDAGHPNWIPPAEMAERLRSANVEAADGFALNVSNFYSNKKNLRYGRKISTLIQKKHFVIDTSRNGNGWNGEWCNPSGMSIGKAPTIETSHRLVDAFLWIKPPGESDGECNGGPAAGEWWAEYALDLVQN